MPQILTIAFAVLLALSVPASAASPVPIEDPDRYCSEVVTALSQKGARQAASMVAEKIGRQDLIDSLASLLQVFEGKNFDFSKKVVDRNFQDALRQIVYYSYVENLGFMYFRFNFKMTSHGWVLANFSFKDETNELFPKDFTDR